MKWGIASSLLSIDVSFIRVHFFLVLETSPMVLCVLNNIGRCLIFWWLPL